MRIAFVLDTIEPYSRGGREKRMYEISTRLAAQGHDVHIYTMHWWDTPEKTRVENGVTLHAICKKYELYSGDRRSMKQAVMFGIACLKLGNVKCDVLEVDHMPYFPIFGAWLARALRGKRINATWHEVLTLKEWVEYMGLGGYVAAMLERISIKLPYAISVASPHTMQRIKDCLHRTKRLNLVASGVDLRAISAVKPSPTKTDIIAVGRLVKDKNTALLIQAIGLIKKDIPNVSCRIIGRGPERDNLESLIKKLNIQQNVQLIEYLPQAADVYAYIKSSRVFALPSTREGFGIVAIEAMACGVPLVITDAPCNGAKILVNQGKNGFVAQHSAVSLAATIQQTLTHKFKPAIIKQSEYVKDWNDIISAQVRGFSL